MTRNLRQAAKNPFALATLRTTAVLGARLIAQAGTLILLARVFGPAQFGAFAGLSAIAVVFGSLSTFGSNIMLLREVSRTGPATPMVGQAWSITLLCGSVLFVGFVLLHQLLPHSQEISLAVVTCIGLTEILLLPSLQLPVAHWQGRGAVARSQMLLSGALATRLAAAIGVALAVPKDPILAYTASYTIGAATALAAALWTTPTSRPSVKQLTFPRPAQWREGSGFAALLVTGLGPSEVDKVLASWLLAPTTAGLYSAATRIVGALVLPVAAMLLVALPRMYKPQTFHNKNTLQRAIIWSTLVYATATSAAMWAGSSLFPLLFGSNYAELPQVVQWLSPVAIPLSLRLAVGTRLLVDGAPWQRAATEFSGQLLLVASASWLIRCLGWRGLPLALMIAEVFMCAIGWLFIRKTRNAHTANEMTGSMQAPPP